MDIFKSDLWYAVLLYAYLTIHWLGIYLLSPKYCMSFTSLMVIPLAFCSFILRTLEFYMLSYAVACLMVLISILVMWTIIVREDHGFDDT